MAHQPTITIDPQWRNRTDGADQAISAATHAIAQTSNWEQLEAFHCRIAMEVVAKARLPKEVPLRHWHAQLFDTALTVISRYGTVRFSTGGGLRNVVNLDDYRRRLKITS